MLNSLQFICYVNYPFVIHQTAEMTETYLTRKDGKSVLDIDSNFENIIA